LGWNDVGVWAGMMSVFRLDDVGVWAGMMLVFGLE